MEGALTLLSGAFDVLLVLTLLWLAWRLLATPNLFKAIVLFIAFGLLMALAWVRLNAPDVALAEAAIGAGLTGALFLSVLSRIERTAPDLDGASKAKTGRIISDHSSQKQRIFSPVLSLLAIMVLTIGGFLGWVVWTLPVPSPEVSERIFSNLERSGVSNPVTAVLLNFRAYDTLLEIGVLLLALLGVWSLQAPQIQQYLPPPSPVLMTAVRLLVPVMVLVAGYLLWLGAYAPGGAFQAGAVLGAAGVLWLLAKAQTSSSPPGRFLSASLALGLTVFLAVAVGVMAARGHFLEYPQDWAAHLILLIEAAATISVGVILAALFVGARPACETVAPPEPSPSEPRPGSEVP